MKIEIIKEHLAGLKVGEIKEVRGNYARHLIDLGYAKEVSEKPKNKPARKPKLENKKENLDGSTNK